MQDSNRRLLSAMVLFLGSISFSPTVPAQTVYAFTKIADTNFFVLHPDGPSLNDAGMVAFRGSRRTDGAFGIFAGNGTESDSSDYLTIATNQGFDPGSYVSSRVAFFTLVNGQQGGFFSSDGFSRQPISDTTVRSGGNGRPLMNRRGQVAYVRRDLSRAQGIDVAQNGVSKAVYTIPTSFTRGKLQMYLVFDFGNTQVNDAGAIFFEGAFNNFPVDPLAQDDDRDGLLQGNLSGGDPTVLVSEASDSSGNSVSVELFAANNNGQVACLESVSDQSGDFYRLVKLNGGAATTVFDTRSTPAFVFDNFPHLAINDNGAIVFTARFNDGTGAFRVGIFTGPDPVRDKVIANGDPLLDSTLDGFEFARVGFNNAGQIAFVAFLKNGNSAIVRADPGSGGTEVLWVGTGGGSFGDTGNWRPANGDPPRVPQKTVALSDTAVFEKCENYPVAFGHHTADRLVISCGDVLFAAGDFTAASLEENPPSVEIYNATLTLNNHILNSSHAWIGTSRSARVTVAPGSKWISQGRIEVGKIGDGTLEMLQNAVVKSAESRVGNGYGKGTVIADGSDVSWTTGNLAVGYLGEGELTIKNGATVKSGVALIGLVQSPRSRVVVQGAGVNGSSRWSPDTLAVGETGPGRLEVKDGGFVDTIGLWIAEKQGGSGSVRVSGVGGDSAPSEINTGLLNVGYDGPAELMIKDGGLVDVVIFNAVISFAGRASVRVSGINTVTGAPSTLRVKDLLDVGEGRPASLLIEAGGHVKSARGSVFDLVPSTMTEVKIVGSQSIWEVEGDLKVAGSLGGQAVITLDNGYLRAGTVEIDDGGTIGGVGTLETINLVGNLAGTVSVEIPLVPLVPLGPQNARSGTGGGRKAGLNGKISKQSGGSSTNTLTILGSYRQTAKGRLLIQVGGTNSAEYGHLMITNAANLDGNLTFKFIDGFAPKQGDQFDFLNVGGQVNGAFATVDLKNLAPGFQFNLVTNGPLVRMTALNDGVFVTPLQGQISSSNVVTVGGIGYLPYKLSVTNPCVIVEPTGGVTRQGQELFQTLSERPDLNCGGISTNASHILPLGGLPPGSYQFHFMADGVVVHTVSFDVPAGTGQVLSFTRTAGGELNLQINGLDSVQYTIQTSTDLTDWSDLPAHVGTFLGPYNVFEPFSASKARFYRVKIE